MKRDVLEAVLRSRIREGYIFEGNLPSHLLRIPAWVLVEPCFTPDEIQNASSAGHTERYPGVCKQGCKCRKPEELDETHVSDNLTDIQDSPLKKKKSMQEGSSLS